MFIEYLLLRKDLNKL